MFTVEDYIELLAGLHKDSKHSQFTLVSADYNLIYSLGRQCVKGVAFTDRQLELAKRKIIDYNEQFISNGYSEISLDKTRLPVREIDRSRWIKLVDKETTEWQSPNRSKGPYIAVRFVFNKKLINIIDTIRSTDRDAFYDKAEKTHYFTFTEKNIYNVMNALKDKNFEIDEEVQTIYETILEMNDNKENYIPGIYNFKLKNFDDKAIDYMISDIGSPNKDNIHLYADRHMLYGIEHIDDIDLIDTVKSLLPLSKRLIYRNRPHVFVDETEFNFDRLAESLLELNRLPILIIADDDNDYDVLVHTFNTFRHILSKDSFSVLYRKENNGQDNIQFNQYIKANNLNISLDNNPKVVYINKNKLPKTLLKTQWQPRTILYYGMQQMFTSKIDGYINQHDLIIHYNDNFQKYARFEQNKIEKI